MTTTTKGAAKGKADRWLVLAIADCEGKGTHLAQVLQDTLLDAAFLEIDTRCLNHLIDDLLVDITNRGVRHGGDRRSRLLVM